MKKANRVAVWTVSVMLIAMGASSVITQKFPQGKALYPMPAIRGSLAVVFGLMLVVMGVYVILSIRKVNAGERKGNSVAPKTDV